jgi:Putative prokaryotic signal transducing protein
MLPHSVGMDFVTVFETLNPAEAQLIRSRLAAAGLDAHVEPEIAPFSIEGFSLAAGGIRVKVPEQQGESARAILAAGEAAEE